jgi:hypothetical protein
MSRIQIFKKIPGMFKKFFALPAREKILYLESFLYQLIAGIVLKLVTFRMITRLFSLPSHLISGLPDPATQLSDHRIVRIKQAIRNTGMISPWKNKCLVQSLAARWMLNRRGIPSKLSLGMTLGPDKSVNAHAWLITTEVEVVEKNGDYLELYNF